MTEAHAGTSLIVNAIQDLHGTVDQIHGKLDGRTTRQKTVPPQGIEAHAYGSGWWFLTWNEVPGATGYEQDHPDTGVGRTTGTRTSLFAVAHGDQRVIRVRALTAGGGSPWVKCTLLFDGRLKTEIDGGIEPPPPRPEAPVVTSVTTTATALGVRWMSDASMWEARLLNDDGSIRAEVGPLFEPSSAFAGLTPDTDYGVQIAALVGNQRSDWSEVRWGRTKPEEPSPVPPAPVVTRMTSGHQNVAVWWTQHPDATHWLVLLLDVDSNELDRVGTTEPDVIFNGLRPGTRYGVQVAALNVTSRSPWSDIEWITTTNSGEQPPPEKPRGLTAHCIADISAKVEWKTSPDVDGWEVSIEGDPDGADFTISTWVQLSELQPDTEYTVHVVAVDGDRRSEPGVITFTTRDTVLPPEPDSEDRPDFDPPTGLMVEPTGPDSIDAWWDDDGSDHAVVSLDRRHGVRVDGRRITWSGLEPGEQVTVHVYTVRDGNQLSGVASKAATTYRIGRDL